MPAIVKILVEGQTNADFVAETGEEKTRPTITLVRDGDMVLVADPGILESQQILIDALEKEDLSPADVDIICITHSHVDHYRNVGMFPTAKVLEYFGLWDKEGAEDWTEQFSPNIQVLHTPGHDYTGITLFAFTENGIVAICGDVFWKENYPQNPEDDAYAQDPKKLEHSRRVVLEKADWIIPGHAGMYKVDKAKIFLPKAVKSANNNVPFAICKKCGRPIKDKLESCRCRPYLCYRCCECHLDCDLCSCSHRRRKNSE